MRHALPGRSPTDAPEINSRAQRRTSPRHPRLLNPARDGFWSPNSARQFETSQVTIRKDLEILHAHGWCTARTAARCPSREGALEDPTLREKEKLHHQEKLRIAEHAASRK
jgi:hypothetical protein